MKCLYSVVQKTFFYSFLISTKTFTVTSVQKDLEEERTEYDRMLDCTTSNICWKPKMSVLNLPESSLLYHLVTKIECTEIWLNSATWNSKHTLHFAWERYTWTFYCNQMKLCQACIIYIGQVTKLWSGHETAAVLLPGFAINKVNPGYFSLAATARKPQQLCMFLHISARVWGLQWSPHTSEQNGSMLKPQ